MILWLLIIAMTGATAYYAFGAMVAVLSLIPMLIVVGIGIIDEILWFIFKPRPKAKKPPPPKRTETLVDCDLEKEPEKDENGIPYL